MPADVLGRGFNDQIGAEVEGAADIRRCERVVDEIERAGPMGKVRNRPMIRDEGCGIGRGLGIYDPRGCLGQRGFDGIVIGHVHEHDFDAEPPEIPDQLAACRSVPGQRRDNPVTRLEYRGTRGMDRAHARCQRDTGFPAGELGIGVPERRGRRV